MQTMIFDIDLAGHHMEYLHHIYAGALRNEEEIVEEMLKNQPIKVREKREARSALEGNDGQIEKAQDRLEVLKKIEEFEREGKFDVDAICDMIETTYLCK